MSYKDYKMAVDLLEQNIDLADFVGNIESEIIKKAEKTLNLSFSKTYKEFLTNYGAGNFGSEEIYGIVKNNFENSGIPDAVWYTLKQRKELQLPQNLLIIYHTGGEELFCLDFNKINTENEPAVVSFLLGIDLQYQTYEIIAEDFGEFLLQRVKIELEG